jgi:hypothetical protein
LHFSWSNYGRCKGDLRIAGQKQVKHFEKNFFGENWFK